MNLLIGRRAAHSCCLRRPDREKLPLERPADGAVRGTRRRADSVLLVDAHGNVVEGQGFNVFCVSHDALVTPKVGVLEGVTRRTVIEMAQSLGIELQLRALPADELREAEEVFISTSGGGVLPVTMVDKRPIGKGSPGPSLAAW